MNVLVNVSFEHSALQLEGLDYTQDKQNSKYNLKEILHTIFF